LTYACGRNARHHEDDRYCGGPFWAVSHFNLSFEFDFIISKAIVVPLCWVDCGDEIFC
jgi:hypothetical protein